MCGSNTCMFYFINQRMQEIVGVKKPFWWNQCYRHWRPGPVKSCKRHGYLNIQIRDTAV